MSKESKETLLFGKTNYLILIAGVAVIFLGLFLMAGGGSSDPAQFSDELFNFQRLTLAPTTMLVGFGVVLYSIWKK